MKKKSAADVVSLEDLARLREAGFVVIHADPTVSMLKAGGSASEFHYGDLRTEFHRMVAESIRLQNE